MKRTVSLSIAALLGVIALCIMAPITPMHAQTSEATPSPDANITESNGKGLRYFDDFLNPGSINFVQGEDRYPQHGFVTIADGTMCDEISKLEDVFDTIPLPVYGSDFYAETTVTVNDADIGVGFVIGDFAKKSYYIYFLINSFDGFWESGFYYFSGEPGLHMQTSKSFDEPLWSLNKSFRIALESKDGKYSVYLEKNGAMELIDQPALDTEDGQIGLALWGSVKGVRKACFDSVEVRSER